MDEKAAEEFNAPSFWAQSVLDELESPMDDESRLEAKLEGARALLAMQRAADQAENYFDGGTLGGNLQGVADSYWLDIGSSVIKSDFHAQLAIFELAEHFSFAFIAGAMANYAFEIGEAEQAAIRFREAADLIEAELRSLGDE